jgi:hypothetical protein
MRCFVRSSVLTCAVAAVGLPAGMASAANILSSGDFVIAIDNNRNLPGTTNTGGEGPLSLFDENNASKWLSFGRSWTGVIVTPAGGPAVVKSLSFTTGGDAPNRDPVQFLLFGTNDTITTVDNGTGLENSWTLIGGGATGLAPANQAATARSTTGAPVDVANTTAYASYKVVFPKLRAGDAAANTPTTPNSVQVGEMRMFNDVGGGGTNVAASPLAAIAFDETDSFFPAGERPLEAIDGSKAASSKYLNFGREGAGLIITPAIGSTVVKSFQITTGNDTEGRDPASYEIYGTNALIASLEDSRGDAEAWTLISSGALALPAARNADGDIVGFDNALAFTSYKIVFPENKGPDGGSVNSIQFSEIALFDTVVPEPAMVGVVAVAAVGMLARRRRRA